MELTDSEDVEGEGEEKQGLLLASGWMVGPLTETEQAKGRRELDGVSTRAGSAQKGCAGNKNRGATSRGGVANTVGRESQGHKGPRSGP